MIVDGWTGDELSIAEDEPRFVFADATAYSSLEIARDSAYVVSEVNQSPPLRRIDGSMPLTQMETAARADVPWNITLTLLPLDLAYARRNRA